jgi:glycerophosphoryl diester phosphodiesterase
MAREIRREPIFGLPTPLLFAHRGGVREAPESTVKGFTHALEARADVLELDVQLTKDGAFVV